MTLVMVAEVGGALIVRVVDVGAPILGGEADQLSRRWISAWGVGSFAAVLRGRIARAEIARVLLDGGSLMERYRREVLHVWAPSLPAVGEA